jgi:hypothetical protein
MHRFVPDNPARGKAQGRIGPAVASRGNGPQTGVEAQKSTPASSPAHPPFRSASNRRMGHPDENQSGRMIGSNDTWARTGRNAVLITGSAKRRLPVDQPPSELPGASTRPWEQTCEGTNPRSAIG